MIKNKKNINMKNISFINLLLIILLTQKISIFSLKLEKNQTKNLIENNNKIEKEISQTIKILNKNFLQLKSLTKIANTNTNKKTNLKLNSKQFLNLGNTNPLQAFLETIANKKETSFCIKVVLGKPQKHKSYMCPPNMFISDSNLNICQKKCPKGMVQNISNCEMPCKIDYQKLNDRCVNNSKNLEYKIQSSKILYTDPVCINGYFFNEYCFTCMGKTDYSNGVCLSPCKKGDPSESFCAYTDYSNRNLSVINVYWAEFLRAFYNSLFDLFKTGILKRNIYENAKNLNDISEILRLNKEDNNIKIDSGKIIIYLRDKFAINMNDPKLFLRNVLYKMFSKYAIENKENSNDILNVVDDLINFSGNYKSPYLDTKQYGIKSLPLTVANLIAHLCDSE
jgi:hypothetical protein